MRGKMDFVWIGWPGLPVEEEEKPVLAKQLMEEVNCVPVFLSADLVDAFYNGFSNDVLWPLLHYFPDEMKFDELLFQAYLDANAAFAGTFLFPFFPLFFSFFTKLTLPVLARPQTSLRLSHSQETLCGCMITS
eukprot:TRINITY_DN12611_c0_g1_i1.p2 TRINITY_DN12611_c0_g1~~TRINITY_DN12611_c0_g1_i1.p2  ORF type:complete len:133 (+),score=31.36 TRINITY_DN12611_c0_g1_i1:124-522(+)